MTHIQPEKSTSHHKNSNAQSGRGTYSQYVRVCQWIFEESLHLESAKREANSCQKGCYGFWNPETEEDISHIFISCRNAVGCAMQKDIFNYIPKRYAHRSENDVCNKAEQHKQSKQGIIFCILFHCHKVKKI